MKYIFATITCIFFLIKSSYAVEIKNIKINNNKRITKETIITYGNIQLNKDYSQKELKKIIKNLYETNFFKNISLKVENKTLVLDIEENKLFKVLK